MSDTSDAGSTNLTPTDAAKVWEVVVVGSGMGGAMAAATFASAGLHPLILESAPPASSTRRKISLKAKISSKVWSAPKTDLSSERWPEPLLFRRRAGQKLRPVPSVIGRVVGGSSLVYGGALGRARRSDFERDWQPAAWQQGARPALPNAWPIDFDEFRTYYSRVETALRVSGTPDPLDPDDDANLLAPVPVAESISSLEDQLKANGRHPFRMHVGIDYRPGCSECQGVRCERACKSDSYTRCLATHLMNGRAQLRTGASVEKLEPRPEGGYDIVVRHMNGTSEIISARRVILAGGALNTPLILQRSTALWPGGIAPRLIGAGLTFHFSDIFAVMGASPGNALCGPMKVLALRDHYEERGPLGECQSLGMASSSWMIAKYLESEAHALGLGGVPFLRAAMDVVGIFTASRFKDAILFTSNLEDLPYLENRVDDAGPSSVPGLSRIAVTYDAPTELIARAKRFRQLMREAFAPYRLRFLKRLGAPNQGHPMGTCRMGQSAETSVTKSDGSVWGHPDLYVVDASAFPSSLGINPALTVAANALRVAEGIVAGITAGSEDRLKN